MSPAGRAGRAAALVVWLVWAAMLAAVLVCIASDGRNVPLAEDWLLVAPMTGHEPDLLRWSWAQNNEHRLPFPRLLLVGLLRLAPDFRAGMVASTLLAGALAAAILLLLRRLRGGRTRGTDVLVPVMFLHLGNWENLVWSWQLSFVTSVALIVLLLLLLTEGDITRSSGRAGAVAATLVLLPLCGATGLIPALPVAVWVAWEGGRSLGRPVASRVAALILLGGAAATLAVTAAYFAGYERATWNPPSPGLYYTVGTAIKYVALGLGPAASRDWLLAAAVAAAILLPAFVPLARAALARRGAAPAEAEDPGGEAVRRARGLLVLLAGLTGLALAIGWGRAGWVPIAGLPTRYVLLSVPTFMLACIAVEIYGSPRLRRTVPAALLAVVCVLLPANIRAGFEWRDWYRAGMTAVEHDIAAGLPRSALVARHQPFLMHWHEPTLSAGMLMLRDASIGPFSRMRDDGEERADGDDQQDERAAAH